MIIGHIVSVTSYFETLLRHLCVCVCVSVGVWVSCLPKPKPRFSSYLHVSWLLYCWASQNEQKGMSMLSVSSVSLGGAASPWAESVAAGGGSGQWDDDASMLTEQSLHMMSSAPELEGGISMTSFTLESSLDEVRRNCFFCLF